MTDARRLARARWYRLLERHPAAFCRYNQRFEGRHIVGCHTDLVVEGYPSAGNSLVRETAMISQRELSIASHLHSAAHIRRGLQLGVPVLVLLREPVASIASLLARFPERGFDAGEELARYERFYRGVSIVADEVALSPFPISVGPFQAVIDVVNACYPGTLRDSTVPQTQLVTTAWEVLDAHTATTHPGNVELSTPRPSSVRSSVLPGMADAVRTASPARLRRCEELHARLVERYSGLAVSGDAHPASALGVAEGPVGPTARRI